MGLKKLLLSVPAALAVLLGTVGAFALWPNEIDAIEARLSSEVLAERRTGALELGRLPKSAALRVLPVALADDDVEVRIAAANAAIQFGFQASTRTVLAWLGEREAKLRLAATTVLAEFPDTPEAVQALSRALTDSEVTVRLAAVHGLGRSTDPRATLALLGQLDDMNTRIQLAVVEALERLADPRAVVPLVGKAQDSRPEMRVAVIHALSRFDDDRVPPALELALRDNDRGVRLAAVSALGRTGRTHSLEALEQIVLGDPSLDVRIAGLWALGRRNDEAGARVLLQALESNRSELVSEVGLVLARMPAAENALITCLRGQPARHAADACAHALARSQSPLARETLTDAWRRRVISAEAALSGLAEIGQPEALPTVLESLNDPDPWTRRLALNAAHVLLDPDHPDGRAVEPLSAALEKAAPRSEEQLRLVALLGRTGATRTGATLAPYAKAEDVKLRLAAIRALGHAKATAEQRVLFKALTDPDPGVRAEASAALRRAGDQELVLPLLQKLDTATHADAQLAAAALAGPLSATKDAKHLAAVEARLGVVRAEIKDALLEALARAPEALSGPVLARAASTREARTQAKVAEALALHPSQAAVLRQLADHPRAEVRANAVWSLGTAGSTSDLELLAARLQDPSAAVAANAAIAWARLASKATPGNAPLLCERLADPRPAVRANALTGLRLLGLRCALGSETSDSETSAPPEHMLLLEDASVQVRLNAARLLRAVPTGLNDEKALERCVAQDRDGRVARGCLGETLKSGTERQPVTVFVVRTGGSRPEPNAPFALAFADGTLRHGTADRRGAVFEAQAPRGPLQLELPAH